MKRIVAILSDGRRVNGELVLEDWSAASERGESPPLSCLGATLSRAYQARKRRLEAAFGAAVDMFRYVDVGNVEKNS